MAETTKTTGNDPDGGRLHEPNESSEPVAHEPGEPSAPAPDVDVDVDEADAALGGDEAAVGSDRQLCSVAFCPIGMALSTVQQARPDAVEHLLAAGREFLLAAKAVLDQRAEDLGGSSKLEKIKIG
jgi:hypothetical protein